MSSSNFQNYSQRTRRSAYNSSAARRPSVARDNSASRHDGDQRRYQNSSHSSQIKYRTNTHKKGSSRAQNSNASSNLMVLLRWILLIAIVGMVVFAITRIVSCATQSNADVVSNQSTISDTTKAAIQSLDMSSVLTDEESALLKQRALENDDVAWIALNWDSYSKFGTEVQTKLLRLAAKEDGAVEFVRNYSEKAGSTEVGEFTCDVSAGEMPFFYQWDCAYGYTSYGDATFGMNGCGPTCMAMIYVAITGDTSMTPYKMGQIFSDNGFVSAKYGTDADVFFLLNNVYGFSYANEVYADYETLVSCLTKGQYLIINVGPGDFTQLGHYIVASGITDDGKLIIHDPNSVVNSNKTWDANTVASQMKRLFAFK